MIKINDIDRRQRKLFSCNSKPDSKREGDYQKTDITEESKEKETVVENTQVERTQEIC